MLRGAGVARRLREVPAPLAALLAVVGLFGVAWALLVPTGQIPDEAHHVQYVQSLAARHELPSLSRQALSSDEGVSMGAALGGDLAGNPTRKTVWTERAYRDWRAHADLPESDGPGPSRQGQNPPLYYLYEAVPYVVVGGHFFDRFYAMRVWSALLLLVTTTAAWLLAGEIFDRDRTLQLAAAALAGLQPMVTFITSGVTPDAMLIAFWSLAFWLGVRVLKRGLTVRDGAALGLVIGLAVVEKATSWALVPAGFLAVAVAWRRLRRLRVPGASVALAAAALAFAVPAGGWVATATALDRPILNHEDDRNNRHVPTLTNPSALREFASYVWQFYLPKLPAQAPFFGQGEGGHQLYDTWVKTGWAAFGWLEVRFPPWVYRVLEVLSIGFIAGGLAALARAFARRRVDLAVVAFFAAAVVVLMAVLHWAEYTIVKLDLVAFNQGRYILPLISLGGVAVAAAISLLPRRWRGLGVAALLAGLLVLQLASLGLNVDRYFV